MAICAPAVLVRRELGVGDHVAERLLAAGGRGPGDVGGDGADLPVGDRRRLGDRLVDQRLRPSGPG